MTDRGEVTARAVVVATDPPTSARLLPGLDVPAGRDVTTWYFVADTEPRRLTGGEPILVVDGRRAHGPVINTVVLTHAAPSYASEGRTLVSASALGLHTTVQMEQRVRTQLAEMYGVGTARWDVVGTYPIPYALPSMEVPLDIRRPVNLGDGLFVAGDHRDTASIQGAMVSGRRTAEAVLARLGLTVAVGRADRP
jgi:hypothetical protein